MLVVVATDAAGMAAAQHHLEKNGASTVSAHPTGKGRVLVYGGPFDDQHALDAANAMRAHGWPADVRPEHGGHLSAWQTNTRPVRCGRLTVCFPWSEFDRDGTDELVEIDPGRAFGTGGHPSTKLLLDQLATRISGGEKVLDIGCGTGILAIAAARLGAGAVTATDIEPAAISVTTVNARRNGVEHLLTLQSDLTSGAGCCDIVVANIEAQTLMALAAAIKERLDSTGWLAVSGFSPAQTSMIEVAYRPLQPTRHLQIDDWAALILSRVPEDGQRRRAPSWPPEASEGRRLRSGCS